MDGNGSVIAQFLFNAYYQSITQAVAEHIQASIASVTPWLHAALMIYIIVMGYQMMFNALAWNIGVTRITRALIVSALMTTVYYDQFIVQSATHTIPDAITNAVTGQTGLSGAQGWDALNAATAKYAADVRAQAVGPLYIGERIIIWAAAGTARVILLISYFIWSAAMAVISLLVALGPYVIPFYLFDKTRPFCERWYGKIIAMFIVLAVTLIVSQIVVVQNSQYMQQYATTINNAEPAAPEALFSGPDFINTDPALANDLKQGTGNVDEGIDTLWNIVSVFAYGLFLMVVMTGIALYIGGASGFSAAPVFNTAMGVSNMVRRGR